MNLQGHENQPDGGIQTPQNNNGEIDVDATFLLLEPRTPSNQQLGNGLIKAPPDLELGKDSDTQQSNSNITQGQQPKGFAQPPNLNTSQYSNHSSQNKEQYSGSIIRTDRGSLQVNFKTVELPQDVYSIGYLAPRYSWPFWYAFLVFGFQAAILWLNFIDLTMDDPGKKQDQNYWKVPPEVSTEVVIAQFLALLVAVLGQDDVTTSLFFISVGVGPQYPEFQTTLQMQYPGKGSATFPRFWITNLLRFTEGLVTILVTFVFIIQSDTVIDIFLSLAAVQFVADLDDLGFRLALEGWFGVSTQYLAKRIRQQKIPIKKSKGPIDYFNRILLFLLVMTLFSMNALTVWHQVTGNYVELDACLLVQVQFGPEVYQFPRNTAFQTTPTDTIAVDNNSDPPLGMWRLKNSQRWILNNNANATTTHHPPALHFSYFSGHYQADFEDKDGIDGRRPVYYEASRIEGMDYQQHRKDSSIGMFYYCEKEFAWVWTVRAFVDAGAVPNATLVEAGDANEERCKYGWLMKSPVTRAVVLDEVPMEGWKVWTGSLSDASSLSISCLECEQDSDCGLIGGTCAEKDKLCKCNKDTVGDFCTERDPCQQLIRFTETGEDRLYNKTDSYSYGRPVYAFAGQFNREEVEEGAVQVVKYTGRQWMAEIIPAHVVAAVQEGINRDRHAYWSGALYDPSQYEHYYYYSEPTNQFLPTGSIQWYVMGETRSEGDYGPRGREIQIQHRYSCWSLDCNASAGLCGKYGKCIPDAVLTLRNESSNLKGGKCVCDEGYYGHFCEFKMIDDEL